MSRARGRRLFIHAVSLWRIIITNMSTPKEELLQLIQNQPDDASYEDIVREVGFAVMIQRGLADSDARRIISNEEMGRRIRSWRK
jgi:hypothetical protein